MFLSRSLWGGVEWEWIQVRRLVRNVSRNPTTAVGVLGYGIYPESFQFEGPWNAFKTPSNFAPEIIPWSKGYSAFLFPCVFIFAFPNDPYCEVMKTDLSGPPGIKS